MGEELGEGDFTFAGLREFRPELGYATFESDAAFLEGVEEAGTSETFRRRPEEDDGVSSPWLFSLRITKSTVAFKDRLSILPNRDSGAELT